MKDAQKKRPHTKRFRHIVRRIRIEAENAFRYYSVAIIAFSLAMALLAAIFVLRRIGYQFSARMDAALLIAILLLLLVCMLGGLWGMILLSLTRKDEHIKAYFPKNARPEKRERVLDAPSALRLEDSAEPGTDIVFLIAALALWLGGDSLFVFWLTGQVPLARNVSLLTLLVTWFPAIRATRLIRGGYERVLLWYRPRPLRSSDGKEGSVDEQAK